MRKHQEEFMAQAWNQAGDVVAANRILAQAATVGNIEFDQLGHQGEPSWSRRFPEEGDNLWPLSGLPGGFELVRNLIHPRGQRGVVPITRPCRKHRTPLVCHQFPSTGLPRAPKGPLLNTP